MSSSSPVYEDYNPLGSQDRPERENSSEDHARKRRRIEAENTHASNMTDPSRPPPNSRRPVFPAHYDFLGPTLHAIPHGMPLGLPIGTFLEEDAALEYLTSGSGFAQDLRDINLSQPPPPPFYVAPNLASRSAALTSHPSQSSMPQQPGLVSFNDFFVQPTAPTIPERRRHVEGNATAPSGNMTAAPTPFDFSGHPPYRPPSYPPHIPVIEGISPPRRTAPISTPATGEVTKKPATMLILSRASEDSIKALDEHKRDCPTCCLQFEPNNFVAVITCCNMAIHARCLSAYVNSQGYSKSRVCMKCRRGIDAKYMLNKVMPPVTDKDWDEGGDFNAPESLQAETKIELNVTARPHRAGSHRHRISMGYSGHRAGRHTYLPLEHLTAEQRLAVLHLREDHLVELEELRNRCNIAMENSGRLNHQDLDANRALVDAQTRATQQELSALLKRCQETRLARDKAREAYERARMELEALHRAQSRRVTEMIEEYQAERERELEARSRDGEAPRSAPIAIPQLRVVNGDPPSSVSP
ncbi:hypothetical protein CLCR_01929 [Cladophialophora carrionii]|uniref:RING-type domain-containing protein n=1 Tax=Cladophialophora carrionii TaxID=86049 RepID=A0A1C1CDV7_9EURO|nr:hypothetical protein CLCR_01929 [Cladophialophora carrionii]